MCLQEGDKEELIYSENHGGNILSFVKASMSKYTIRPGNSRVFCGGLIGYITYEAIWRQSESQHQCTLAVPTYALRLSNKA